MADIEKAKIEYGLNQKQFDQHYAYQHVVSVSIWQQLLLILKHQLCPCRSGCSGLLSTVLRRFPIFLWLPKYRWRIDLVNDMIAGLTLGMAYSVLASLPPVYGLYTSFTAPLLYMLFGTSKHVSIAKFRNYLDDEISLNLRIHNELTIVSIFLIFVLCLGVFSIVCIMIGNSRLRILPDHHDNVPSNNMTINATTAEMINSISMLFEQGQQQLTPVSIVTTLALLVGFVQLLMALLRLDFLAAYLSDPLVSGYTTGAAVQAVSQQLDKVIGVKVQSRPSGLFSVFYVRITFIILNAVLHIYDICLAIPQTNVAVLILSILSMAFLLFGKIYVTPKIVSKIKRPIPIPYELILMIICTVISYFGNFEHRYKMSVVDHIPTGFPQPTTPQLFLIPRLINDAIGIAAVAFVVTLSMGKLFARRHRYRIDANQELCALGIAGIISSFFSSFPSSTSLSRSLVNEAAGAKSQLTALFSSMLLMIVILWLGPLMETLPMIVWILSCIVTVSFDLIEGLAISIAIAMLTIVIRTQRYDWQQLGRLPNCDRYCDVKRYQTAVTKSGDNVAVISFNAPLIFTNVEIFKKIIRNTADDNKTSALENDETNDKNMNDDYENQVNNCLSSIIHVNLQLTSIEKSPPVVSNQFIIIDCSRITYLDAMAIDTLIDIYVEMHDDGVTLLFSSINDSIRDNFEMCKNFYRTIPIDRFYPTVHDAVVFAQKSLAEFTIRSERNLNICVNGAAA